MPSSASSLHELDKEPDPAQKWQQILADLITEPKELLKIVELDSLYSGMDETVLRQFPLKVPRTFAARMEKGNPADPLLAQVLPLALENARVAGFTDDPLAEGRFNPAPGLLHKYAGRVLLTVAPHCAVHCRYCFRRHFDYEGNTPGRRQWRQALDYIAANPDVSEVIFSGGDPLACKDHQLAWLVGELAGIPHVQRLRVHSRTPIMIPQRVVPSLIQWMTETRLQTLLVVHCNHAREIDREVAEAMTTLHRSGIPLLNQSVLLRGVNDSAEALKQLSESLFACNVLPYYLHLLDRVSGVAHFEVPESEARQIIETLRRSLPGYLVPRLVREIPGEPAKTPVG